MKTKKTITYIVGFIAIAILIYMYFSKNEFINPVFVAIIPSVVMLIVNWDSKK